MTRCRVTFVLPSLHGGGAERAAVTLINGLVTRDYDATLYLFAREGAYVDQPDPAVRVVVGEKGRLARFAALRRFLAREPQDVVVSFLSHFTVYAAVRTSGTAATYVISQQTPLSAFLEDEDYPWRRPVQRRVFAGVARTVYPRADLVVATSAGVADDLVTNYGVARERTAIVHNPVDVDAVEKAAGEPIDPAFASGDVPTIVMAGRLAHAKNLPLFAASLELLARRTPFRAWVLGQGELEGELRRLLAKASLTDRVSLLGFQGNPWKFMARGDVFLLTSRYEGFGNVLIEAMAAGLPVVATASFGTREIVDHEQTGLLVEEHQAGAVAAALERMITEPGLRRRLAAAARAKARTFSVPAVVDRFDAVVSARLCPQ